MTRVVLVLLLAACGPKATAKPKPYDTAKLARDLHDDLVELGAIAKQHRTDCVALVAALRPHVERMRAHATEVKRVQQDVALAKQLRKDVAAYDDKGLGDAIGADLGAAYQTCPDNQPLLEQIDRIPEL